MRKMSSWLSRSASLGLFCLSSTAAHAEYKNTGLPSLDDLPVELGGFFSQGLITTSDNNYLAETDGEISTRFTEAAINATFSPFPRTIVSAQAFMFDLGPGYGGTNEVLLDYAFLDYTATNWLGLRVGRVKRPQGIYNTIRDVDLARTSILLPQGLYDNRWRDFYSYVDGASVYGFIMDGAIEYEFYYGKIDLGPEGGITALVETDGAIVTDVEHREYLYGGQIWWNTPLDGLRIGQAFTYVDQVVVDLDLSPAFSFPLGTVIAESPTDGTFYTTSLQYFWGDWTLEAEYLFREFDQQSPTGRIVEKGLTWYVSLAYQIAPKWALGTYITEHYDDTNLKGTPSEFQRQIAVSARYDYSENLSFKAEVHRVHGTGLLYNDQGQNNTREDDWWIFALKTTLSF